MARQPVPLYDQLRRGPKPPLPTAPDYGLAALRGAIGGVAFSLALVLAELIPGLMPARPVTIGGAMGSLASGGLLCTLGALAAVHLQYRWRRHRYTRAMRRRAP